uniref:Uncharacterized protein n=1 Tax=Oryza brachyantha TaxID=4533 RepID=J3KUN5_ORYBR
EDSGYELCFLCGHCSARGGKGSDRDDASVLRRCLEDMQELMGNDAEDGAVTDTDDDDS